MKPRRPGSRAVDYHAGVSAPICGLYVIIDPAACRDRSPVTVALLALEGGASVVQWRDKVRGKGDQLEDARAIAELCREHGAGFIVNDHADLALAVEADGVHLGPHDLPVRDVRSIVRGDMIVGASTNNAEEARAAVSAGATYVAVGSIFPTASKGDTRPADLDRIREVTAALDVPVVAIGGINASNIARVVEAGADAAAVISAVCAADDPRDAARELAVAFPSRDTEGRSERPRLDVQRLVERYVARFNASDRDAWVALFSRDAVQHDPVGEPPHRGVDEIAAWWDRAVAVYDGIIIEPRRISVNGVEAAMSWRIVERHDGKQRAFEGVDVLRFDSDGLIAEVRAYWDRDSLPDFA